MENTYQHIIGIRQQFQECDLKLCQNPYSIYIIGLYIAVPPFYYVNGKNFKLFAERKEMRGNSFKLKKVDLG